jgi:hypothetical protein
MAALPRFIPIYDRTYLFLPHSPLAREYSQGENPRLSYVSKRRVLSERYDRGALQLVIMAFPRYNFRCSPLIVCLCCSSSLLLPRHDIASCLSTLLYAHYHCLHCCISLFSSPFVCELLLIRELPLRKRELPLKP